MYRSRYMVSFLMLVLMCNSISSGARHDVDMVNIDHKLYCNDLLDESISRLLEANPEKRYLYKIACDKRNRGSAASPTNSSVAAAICSDD